MDAISSSPLAASFGRTHFGQARLGDRRRTKRLVQLADALVRHPGGTLPQKLQASGELDGAYHLMQCPTVTHAAILKPHREHTLTQIARHEGPVLIVHDTTELDFSTHRSLRKSLGQIGNGSRTGYLCHNSLAVDPASREVLGLTQQILHRRAKVRKGETQKQRRERRNRESRLWVNGTAGLPADWNLIDVCDRGADTFEFLEHASHSGRRFVVRAAYNRAIHVDHSASAPRALAQKYARTLSPLTSRTLALPQRLVERRPKKTGKKQLKKQAARTATLHIAAAPVLLRAPSSKNGLHGDEPLPLWIVRVYEADAPKNKEALEWFLWTNQPVDSVETALQVVGWYECRWIIEEYHKAMKTGCGIESPQFRTAERLQPMVALLSVVALTLLNLRAISRRPDAKTRPASDVISRDYIAVLSTWRLKKPRLDWTIHEFFFALARLGGHLNRKHDKPPGWLVLWRGWHELQAMLDGAKTYQQLLNCA